MISILASLTQWRKPQESNTQISIFSSVAIPWAVPWPPWPLLAPPGLWSRPLASLGIPWAVPWPPWPLLGSGALGPWASGPGAAKTNTAANKNDTAAITTNDSSSKHYDSSNYQTMDGILGPLVPGPYPPLGLPCALPISAADQGHKFCSGSMSSRLERFYSSFVHRGRDRE